MKKYYFLIIVALILGLVLTGCSLLSNVGQVPTTGQSGITYLTKGGPSVIPLYAGKDIPVGTVTVLNDDEDLYVTYNTIDGWVMTETHLAVADSLNGIPQTKKGNPIPGKFEHSMEHDPTVTEYTYMISLEWAVDTELIIAAHAAVIKEYTTIVVSDTNTMVVGVGNAVEAWEPFSDADPSYWDNNVDHSFSASADWIWESYRPLHTIAGDIVEFEKTFNIEGYPISGTFYITCDNGYEAYLNELLLGSAQLQGDWMFSNLTETFVVASTAMGDHWNTVEEYDVIGKLQPGINVLKIYGVNEYMGPIDGESNGTENTNPAGLIFEGEIISVQEETAWAAGEDFPGKNWATFFYYIVQETIIIDGILSPGEWDDATAIPVTGDMGTVRVLATTDYLYVAFDVVDSNDARTQYTGEEGNDQISINVNPTDGGLWGFPYDLIFEASALSGGCSGSPEDGGHHCLPWTPKVNSGTSTDNWATRWFPNDAQESLPGDLESATVYSSGKRITEWKLPLASITVLTGDVLKVGGAIDVGDGTSYVYPVGLDWNIASTFVDIVVY